MIESLISLIAPYVMAVLAVLVGIFGWRSSRNKRAAERATEEARIYRQQAESRYAADEAQERAQEAARGVPVPRPPDPKKRDGFSGRW